ncbi:MAG TPA: sulfate adenylyltransferase subunit CysD [Steroidobacteraceae bacterium]|jgi:sulfate adenylyltransferase subunit 2|nr:sulfate adenylyltransferase subunit CysD [Steroidobacteraceae bacterium]
MSNHPRSADSNLTHLQRLESESIHIMREVIAESDNPVMLYSAGKDSAVMLHLARKAFFPAAPPFPLLHVDTTWKFRAMYEMRDRVAKISGMRMIVHQNPDAAARGINPFDHGSLHTDLWKTEGLKQALAQHGFDAALAGARRDEEKSRAKERIFSFRSANQRWDPKNQRPELWNIYNARKNKGESIRVFPLSNWTELDVWQYIHLERIAIASLYFAALRPTVEREGLLIMVDDDRFRLRPGETAVQRTVRFRTLGCYPLTGAVESNATTVPQIIQEMLLTTTSERQGRAIDYDQGASMELKKQAGYF